MEPKSCAFCTHETNSPWVLTENKKILYFCDTCHSHMQDMISTRGGSWHEAITLMFGRIFRHILEPVGLTPTRVTRLSSHL